MSVSEDVQERVMQAHGAALSHVFEELKKHQLGARVTLVEVSSRGITVSFEASAPAETKRSKAELALERAAEEESIMYGSAGT